MEFGSIVYTEHPIHLILIHCSFPIMFLLLCSIPIFAQQRTIVIDDSKQKSLQEISILIDGASPIELLDNGILPDKAANDGIHTGYVEILSDITRMQFNAGGEKINELSLSIHQENILLFDVQNGLIAIPPNSTIQISEYKIGKTPIEMETQPRQSSDSIIAHIKLLNQGSPLKNLSVTLDGNTYPISDDGQGQDQNKDDNIWTIRISAKKQETLQLLFEDGQQWSETIVINCSDEKEQNIDILRMSNNFLSQNNEESSNQKNENDTEKISKPTDSNLPPLTKNTTSPDTSFQTPLPESKNADIYLIAIAIVSIFMVFTIQIYIRWKRDISPLLYLLEQYLAANGYQKTTSQISEADINIQIPETNLPEKTNTSTSSE